MRQPSPSQWKAINHKDGPAQLIAGPGSGKTFTIVQRIIHLIEDESIPPDQILVLTFSKAAAQEMKTRFISESDSLDVHFATFHSLAYYILRTSFSFSPQSLISDNEKRTILAQIFRNSNKDYLCSMEYLSGILDQLSKLKNSGAYSNLKLESDNEDISTDELNKLMGNYFSFVKELKRLDFDDMVLKCIESLNKYPKVLEFYQNKFKYILVDEFQDINMPQYDLVKLIAYPENNIMSVGDDDQAIYGFRGSSPGIMKRFDSDFPNNNHIYLTENYRSGKNIVLLAGTIINDNKERYKKDFIPINEGGSVNAYSFPSRLEEEKFIISLIKDFSFDELINTCIIVRTNRDISLYKSLLSKNNFPVHSKNKNSKSIFDSFIFEDITAFLKFIYEGNLREYFFRIMNKPNKYIQRAAVPNSCVKKEDILNYYQYNVPLRNDINTFFEKLDMASKMSVNLTLKLIRNSIGYEKYLKEVSKDREDYQNLLYIYEQIEDFFKNLNGRITIDEYVSIARKEYKEPKKSDDEEFLKGVNIITMHTSKGLEFENVILPDINEGIIPAKGIGADEMEESRRLFYVAVTRAKKRLYILSTKERNRDVSRFIKGKTKIIDHRQ